MQHPSSGDNHPAHLAMPVPGSLQLEDASFAYAQSPPLLSSITLSLEPGERVHLRGDNGSGKSTLLNLLVGLRPWQQGRMLVNGRPISHTSDYPWLRQQVGFLSQEPRDHLFCPSVGDDCRFGPHNYGISHEETEQRCCWWLARVGLAGHHATPPSHLSAGQAQLAALAAVCCCHPSILLLDEPSSDLDQQHRDILIETLRQGPWTLCFTSHDPALVEAITTRTITIVDGKLT
ncbi:MAG: ABC transporter ATP-binding protein [Planctomycetota bacterium]|nr:MAG: ABC transporter ATP-binding protein [Planctomycetota bacterium]